MQAKTLFLIDGASGAGKTDMVEYIAEKYARAHTAIVLPKFTTRPRRHYENESVRLDLKFVSNAKFNSITGSSKCYSYKYSKQQYTFRKTDLDTALSKHQAVFIIVRDRQVIRDLIRDYPRIRVVPVYLYTDRDEIRRRLNRQEEDKKAIKFRMDRLRLAWSNYIQEPSLYTDILINNSAKTDFHRLIDELIRKYSIEKAGVLEISADACYQLSPALVGYKEEMLKRLAVYSFDKNVFLMIKFRPENAALRKALIGILKRHNLNGIVADDPLWDITQNVYNPIAVLMCCKYGIAIFDEATNDNSFSPNVMYELGMMHLQGKNCLILKHKTLPESPFDIIKDLHCKYERDFEIESLVQKHFKKTNI